MLEEATCCFKLGTQSKCAQLLQVYDWLKDTTPAEEQAMRAGQWDLEDVKLGPVRTRYRQPNLLIDEDRFSRIITGADEAVARYDAFKVCCTTLSLHHPCCIITVAKPGLSGSWQNCMCT